MRRTRLPNINAKEFLSTLVASGTLEATEVERLLDAYKAARPVVQRPLTLPQLERAEKRLSGKAEGSNWADTLPVLRAAVLIDSRARIAVEAFIDREKARHEEPSSPDAEETPVASAAPTRTASPEVRERRRAALTKARAALAQKRAAGYGSGSKRRVAITA